MAFTLNEAVQLWQKIRHDPKLPIPGDVFIDNSAKDLLSPKSNEDLEKVLRGIFASANVAYPEKSHPLHLKATLLTVLSQN